MRSNSKESLAPCHRFGGRLSGAAVNKQLGDFMRLLDSSQKRAVSNMGSLTLPQLQALLGESLPKVKLCSEAASLFAARVQ